MSPSSSSLSSLLSLLSSSSSSLSLRAATRSRECAKHLAQKLGFLSLSLSLWTTNNKNFCSKQAQRHHQHHCCLARAQSGTVSLCERVRGKQREKEPTQSEHSGAANDARARKTEASVCGRGRPTNEPSDCSLVRLLAQSCMEIMASSQAFFPTELFLSSLFLFTASAAAESWLFWLFFSLFSGLNNEAARIKLLESKQTRSRSRRRASERGQSEKGPSLRKEEAKKEEECIAHSPECDGFVDGRVCLFVACCCFCCCLVVA